MLIRPAMEEDFAEIVELANVAYRGRPGAASSWNIETGILEGQRMDESLLRDELAAKPDGFLLTYRDEASGPLLGTVWLNPEADGKWYLGLFTIRPDLQNRGLGRALLESAEKYAKQRGAEWMRMTVLH